VSGYGLEEGAIEVRSLAEARDFSSNLCVQTGSGAHPASCTMGIGGVLSPGVKRGQGVTMTTYPIYCRGREWVGAIHHPLRLHRCVVGQLYLHIQVPYIAVCRTFSHYDQEWKPPYESLKFKHAAQNYIKLLSVISHKCVAVTDTTADSTTAVASSTTVRTLCADRNS
jgi:hypothetical protein